MDRKSVLIKKSLMNRQSREKLITVKGSISQKSKIIMVFLHQGQIVREANFLVSIPTRSIDDLLELNN